MQRIKAVLFDLDGVLLDSEAVWFEAFNEILEKNGKNRIDGKTYDEVATGSYLDEDISNFFGNAKEEEIVKFRMEWMNAIIKKLDQISLYPQVNEILIKIKNSGLKIGCVTNTPTYLTESFLRFFDLTDKFDALVTGDMVKNRKPFPDPVLLACKKLNLPPENCVFIEDSTKGVRAGKDANVLTIAITTTTTRSKLEEAGADIIIESLSDLFKHI